MITFFVAPALLLGYLTYGKVVEHIFGPDDRPTPAAVMADGVDYVEMPTWKVFLIQLLNIAGTGPIFGALAVIGVVACPITSGDTALRSARLTLADWFHIDQSKIGKRLALTIPLLGLGALLTQLDFDVVWRYFSWANQTPAMIALWAAAVYLVKNCGMVQSLMAACPPFSCPG